MLTEQDSLNKQDCIKKTAIVVLKIVSHEDIHSFLSRRMCHYIMIVAWNEAILGVYKARNNEDKFIYKEIMLQIVLHI